MNLKKYFPEFVYGGMDGLITTFAIITGAAGAQFETHIIVIIGLASVFADAFSMGASNFVSQRSACRIGELVCEKGYPLKTAVSTFIAFIIVGIVPLVPFILSFQSALMWSLISTFILFFVIGVFEGYFSKSNPIYTGIGTLLIGIVAASIAYGVGHLLSIIV